MSDKRCDIEHNSCVYRVAAARNLTFGVSFAHDGERRGDHRGRSRVRDGVGRREYRGKTKEGKATLGKQTDGGTEGEGRRKVRKSTKREKDRRIDCEKEK